MKGNEGLNQGANLNVPQEEMLLNMDHGQARETSIAKEQIVMWHKKKCY